MVKDEDFAVLGVQPDADMVVVDAAYRALLAKLGAATDPASREKVKSIKAAYIHIQAVRGRAVERPVSWWDRIKFSPTAGPAVIIVALCLSGLLVVAVVTRVLPGLTPDVAPPSDQVAPSQPVLANGLSWFEEVRPQLERWPTLNGTLSVEGLGPARIGMTVEDVEKAIGELKFDQNFESCKVATPKETSSVSLLFEYGVLTRVSVYEPNPAQTPRGIRIGSTTEQVRAAYGPDLLEDPHLYNEAPAQYLTYFLPKSDGGRPGEGVRFETDAGGRVVAMHGGLGSLGYVEGCL